MDVLTDPRVWARATFAEVDLGDRRRGQRLVESAARIAANPGRPFPQVFDWNSLRGFYRLCQQSEATLEALQRPHWQQTRHALAEQPLALIVHDTSELDFSGHPALEGLGPIGDHRGRGFLQHNSLAIVPGRRRVLGLAYQQLWVRPAPNNLESPLLLHQGENQEANDEEDESVVWLNGIRATGRPPVDCCWVDVGDRGSDDYQVMRASREVGHHFLLRLSQQRSVFVTPELDRQGMVGLLDFARTLTGQADDVVDIPGRGGRSARSAHVRLAAAPVWIPAPAGTPQRWSQPVVAAWVIRVWEAQPPTGVEALEWLLCSSLAATTAAELKERRDWYACRWLVEQYHLVEKSGCAEEDRRFETAERMVACLAILALVAVRILQLRCALEWQATESAEQVATVTEIEVLQRFTRQRRPRWTVRDFVRGVARLGGFLGRRGDGEPGVQTLWRGYQRLQDMLLGYELHQARPSRGKNVGNR
jgi:hypothetical protein